MALRLRTACCATAALALAAPAVTQAANKTVTMGPPPTFAKAFQKTGNSVNAFFPSNVAIHAGDTVTFSPFGFHNVDLPPRGGGPAPSFGPTSKRATSIDAAGIPFWFVGQPAIGNNPKLFRPATGKPVVKGAGRVLGGLPLGPPKPTIVRFPKAGLYPYFCDLHAGMKGTVRVAARGRPIPSARLDALRVKKQASSALAIAKSLVKSTKPTANTIAAGAEGKGGVHYFGFIPSKLTVPAGTTVTFANPAVSTESHTATFGPGDVEKKGTYLGGIAATLESPAPDARIVYPSEAPGTPPASLSGALHGNGFWNTGLIDGDARSPFPATGAVKFDTPGSYGFVCLIHPEMKGTITVK